MANEMKNIHQTTKPVNATATKSQGREEMHLGNMVMQGVKQRAKTPAVRMVNG